MHNFYIDPKWKPLLEEAGLSDFHQIMSFDGGTCLSRHSRGKTNMTRLSNGQTIFVKQDFYTRINASIRNWLRGLRAEANVIREMKNEAKVSQLLNVPVAKIIAWGEKRLLGVPCGACIIMLPVAGIPLDELAKTCPDKEKVRQAIAKAETVLQNLQENRCDWRIDCKPEHFFVDESLNISLIDMERMRFPKCPLTPEYRQMQWNRFHSLLPKEYR